MNKLKEKASQLLTSLLIALIIPFSKAYTNNNPSGKCTSDRDCHQRSYCLKGIWQCVSGFKDAYSPVTFVDYRFCLSPNNCYTIHCLRESSGFSSIVNDPDDPPNIISGFFFYLTIMSILIISAICYCYFREKKPRMVWSHRIEQNLRREARSKLDIRWIFCWISQLWTSLRSRSRHGSNIPYSDAPTLVVLFNESDSSLRTICENTNINNNFELCSPITNYQSDPLPQTTHQKEKMSSLPGLSPDLPPSDDEVTTTQETHQETHQKTHQETHEETHQRTHQETHQETHQDTHQETHQQETPSSSHEQHHSPVQPPPYDSLKHSKENLNDI